MLLRIRNRLGLFVADVEPLLDQGRSVASQPHRVAATPTIFIGHGGSSTWKDLRDFVQERLKVRCAEFNTEPVAGMTVSERLEEMLASSAFAFLVMTGEDRHSDKTVHARENVIHEIGLFQGRLGRRRAIVLLEEGCSEFSNIAGLTQLRFPKGNVLAVSEEIRKLLERANLLTSLERAG